MQVLRSLPCIGCGAGLPLRVSERQYTCEFCGLEQALEEGTELDESLDLAADIEALEEEARGALSLAASNASDRGPLAVGLGVGFLIVSTMLLFIAGFVLIKVMNWDSDGAALLASFLPFVYTAIATTVWMLRGFSVAQERYGEIMDGVSAPEWRSRAGQSLACPGCGTKQAQLRGAAVFHCASCDLLLIAAHGMLVEMSRQGEKRAEAWTTAAQRITAAWEERVGWQRPLMLPAIWVGIVLAFLLPFIGLLVYAIGYA